MDTTLSKDMGAMGGYVGKTLYNKTLAGFCNISFLSLTSLVRHCRSWRDEKGESYSPTQQCNLHNKVPRHSPIS